MNDKVNNPLPDSTFGISDEVGREAFHARLNQIVSHIGNGLEFVGFLMERNGERDVIGITFKEGKPFLFSTTIIPDKCLTFHDDNGKTVVNEYEFQRETDEDIADKVMRELAKALGFNVRKLTDD